MKQVSGTKNFRAKGQAAWKAMRLNAESGQSAAEASKPRLEEVFAHVCKTFFPRWNRDAQWRVSGCPDGGPNHRIAGAGRTIVLSATPEDDAELQCLLIHEICHAITHTRHDKKWLHRMKQAVDKALAIGCEDLAARILREVDHYARAGTHLKIMTELIYYSIEDCVFSNPSLSCDEVLESVAFKLGFSPSGLERNWRRCREVYEEAVRKYSLW